MILSFLSECNFPLCFKFRFYCLFSEKLCSPGDSEEENEKETQFIFSLVLLPCNFSGSYIIVFGMKHQQIVFIFYFLWYFL